MTVSGGQWRSVTVSDSQWGSVTISDSQCRSVISPLLQYPFFQNCPFSQSRNDHFVFYYYGLVWIDMNFMTPYFCDTFLTRILCHIIGVDVVTHYWLGYCDILLMWMLWHIIDVDVLTHYWRRCCDTLLTWILRHIIEVDVATDYWRDVVTH